MTSHIATPEELEMAPELPPRGVGVWMRENLFSSPSSSVLTVIALAIAVGGIRGMMGFLFGVDRRWDAVTANLRLLMVQAYPAGDNPTIADEAGNAISQIHRVWISVAVVFVLLALTLAIYRIVGRTSARKVGGILLVDRWCRGRGGARCGVADRDRHDHHQSVDRWRVRLLGSGLLRRRVDRMADRRRPADGGRRVPADSPQRQRRFDAAHGRGWWVHHSAHRGDLDGAASRCLRSSRARKASIRSSSTNEPQLPRRCRGRSSPS